jgi:hypothetical protein
MKKKLGFLFLIFNEPAQYLRPLENIQFYSSSREIPQDNRIG